MLATTFQIGKGKRASKGLTEAETQQTPLPLRVVGLPIE